MTLDQLRPIVSKLLSPCVRVAVRVGMGPDVISAGGFLAAVLAGVFFYFGEWWYVVGAGFVFINGWLDLLDGAVARELAVDSASGDLLDHVLDRYADIVIIAGLAAGVQQYALGFFAITGVLMTSYMGTQAIAVGLERVYGGIMGRADRLVLIGIVGVLAPFTGQIGPVSLVGWLLLVFGIIGHYTALQRFYYAKRDV